MLKALPLDQVTKPVLDAHDAIEITESNMAETTTFYWTKADFGVPTEIEYLLCAEMAGGTSAVIATSAVDSLDITLENLNKALINAGIDPETPVAVQFYVVAALSSTYKVQSNMVTVNVDAFKPLFPDNVYMIGQEFGGWSWSDPGVVEMTPIYDHPGIWWAVRYFANPENGFKWCNVKDWNGDFFSLGSDVGFTTHDGNAFVSAAGFYIVVVDYTQEKITIEPAQVYGMGDCFGGWNTGQYPFVASGNVMKLTTTNSAELRMYAATTAVACDWWQMEFVFFADGKIQYRGTGNDQARFTVAAGKVITLDFNNGMGTVQ
ncbi:MAG: SusF/SusE family outer membrane protein [Prevotellaceae bacterium]|nr:SusF/SusE family outer membrane protein [Prevotellaceae bacterium]